MSALALLLSAMTSLQAIVALGTFSLSVLAPQLGLSVGQLGALNTVLFGAGAVSAFCAGNWIQRWGDLHLAALCMATVAAAMLCLMAGSFLGWVWLLWPAVILLGLAFGPETPASTAALSRITPGPRRPLVFSIRQTGNQIGVIAGSLTLPVLVTWHALLPYAGIGILALGGAAVCVALARNPQLQADPADKTSAGASVASSDTVRFILGSHRMRLLALAMLAYTATQMCLNTFLVSYFVHDWHETAAHAAQAVALLQAGGLAGRVFWGWLGQRTAGSHSLTGWLGLIGLLMAGCGALLVAGGLTIGGLGFGVLSTLLGFTASGWNGIMIAEVVRISGTARAGAVSGAMLMTGYGGLTLAPITFAMTAAVGGITISFLALFFAAALAGGALLALGRDNKPDGTEQND